MRISHKNKFIYVAVPKTGSLTIRKVLGKYSDIHSVSDKTSPYHWHTKASDLREHFIKKNWRWDDYFKFTFVRNPWDMYVSLYKYFQRMKAIPPVVEGGPEFNSFFLDLKRMNSLWLATTYSTYYRAGGDNIVDFIGKFENLQQDFDIVCDKIGIPKQQLPHKNATEHKHYTEYYDDETKQIVEDVYAKDIEHFGYEFGL